MPTNETKPTELGTGKDCREYKREGRASQEKLKS